jgi:hypothetical protein
MNPKDGLFDTFNKDCKAMVSLGRLIDSLTMGLIDITIGDPSFGRNSNTDRG